MQTTELSTIPHPSRRECSPMSRPLGDALIRAYSELRFGELTTAHLPSGARLGLKSRRHELETALTPAEPDRIRIILATLADMPAQVETDPAKIRFAMERNLADLAEFPEWAIAAAARSYRKGEVGDGKWRPTAGELAKFARARVRAWREELAKIEAVLSAPAIAAPEAIDAERRKQVADGVRAQTAAMVANLSDPVGARDPNMMPDVREITDPARAELAKAALDQKLADASEAYSRAPCVLSEAALATMRRGDAA